VASVWKHPESQYWTACFRDQNGRQRRISTKETNNKKALKMLFKSARRGSAIAEDPTEFVETVRKERGIKIKRPFTLPELRSVLDLANDEWRSMILFGLYTGQRLGDIATLRWNNLDLARGELRLSTRKTGKAIVLPLATQPRKNNERRKS
jgi:integrase